MRKIEVQVSNGELVIFDWTETDPNHPEFMEETPIHLPLESALATVNVDGYGQNLSEFIIELAGYPWADRVYVDTIIRFLRENFPQSEIDWEATMNYVDLFR